MGIPDRLLSRVTDLLAEDGFISSVSGVFSKQWRDDWCAWIAVDGSPYALSPRIGVYNEELVRIHDRALEVIDWNKNPTLENYAPPLIMVALQRLIDGDPDCTNRASWQYKGDRLNTGAELPNSVADDLIYCIRKKAYPFFDTHLTLESIVDAARAGMPSHALPYYAPIILLKMNKREEFSNFVEYQKKRLGGGDIAHFYDRYATSLVKVLDLETNH